LPATGRRRDEDQGCRQLPRRVLFDGLPRPSSPLLPDRLPRPDGAPEPPSAGARWAAVGQQGHSSMLRGPAMDNDDEL